MYKMTTAGKHGHIALITNPNPVIRRINKTQYENIFTGQVFNYVVKNGKSYTSLNRSRRKLLDIVNTNTTPTSVFLSLTTKANMQDNMQDNMQNRKIYSEWMRLFCKTDVFRNYFGTSYLYTVEKQKRGALHSHIICFEPLEEPNYSKLIITWRKIIRGIGSVNVIPIDDPDHIGIYLAKYIREELASVPKGKRIYFPSKNLKQPIKKRITYAELKRLPMELRSRKIVITDKIITIVYDW